MSEIRNQGYRSASEDLIPVVMLRLLIALILCVLALVTVARLSDWPVHGGRPQAELITERAVVLSTKGGGTVTITDPDGALISDLAAQEAGFISSIERVFFRERSKIGADHSSPIFIQLRAGDKITIHDPQTGHIVDMSSFGSDNIKNFARFLNQP